MHSTEAKEPDNLTPPSQLESYKVAILRLGIMHHINPVEISSLYLIQYRLVIWDYLWDI